MKVRATKTGFDGWALREPGTVFEIKDSQFSKVWMEKVNEDVKVTGIRSALLDGTEEAKVIEKPTPPMPPMFKSKLQKVSRK